MTKRYSIAEARDRFAALVHELEITPCIELTRRGEPVAVLLAVREYERLQTGKGRFWESYQEFRKLVDLEELDIEPEVFAGIRDPSLGREVTP